MGERGIRDVAKGNVNRGRRKPEQFPRLVYRLSDPKVVIFCLFRQTGYNRRPEKLEDAANAVDRIVEEA